MLMGFDCTAILYGIGVCVLCFLLALFVIGLIFYFILPYQNYKSIDDLDKEMKDIRLEIASLKIEIRRLSKKDLKNVKIKKKIRKDF